MFLNCIIFNSYLVTWNPDPNLAIMELAYFTAIVIIFVIGLINRLRLNKYLVIVLFFDYILIIAVSAILFSLKYIGI